MAQSASGLTPELMWDRVSRDKEEQKMTVRFQARKPRVWYHYRYEDQGKAFIFMVAENTCPLLSET